VTPVSTATGKAGKPIQLGYEAENGNAYIAITPNGRTVYVTESGPYRAGDTITPISAATNKAGKPISVGQWPVAIAITPNGRTVYVASTGSGPGGCAPTDCGGPSSAAVPGSVPATVTPISTATNKPGKAIKISPAGSPAGSISYLASTLAITPNSTTAYVAFDTSVIPIRTATNTALKPIKVGSRLTSIAITPNGKTAYVTRDRFTSQGQGLPGFVIPINTTTDKAGQAIPVGDQPSAIAITP
jgi:DNA-binding beta-propeller fold protein YncE